MYRLKHKHVGTWVSDWESDKYVKVDKWVRELENDSVITPSLVQLLVLLYEITKKFLAGDTSVCLRAACPSAI